MYHKHAESQACSQRIHGMARCLAWICRLASGFVEEQGRQPICRAVLDTPRYSSWLQACGYGCLDVIVCTAHMEHENIRSTSSASSAFCQQCNRNQTDRSLVLQLGSACCAFVMSPGSCRCASALCMEKRALTSPSSSLTPHIVMSRESTTTGLRHAGSLAVQPFASLLGPSKGPS